jgi:hypothetical protein
LKILPYTGVLHAPEVLAMRFVAAVFTAALLASSMGCGLLGKVGRSNTGAAAAKKDCAACEKMCSVAGDAEKNAAGVEACKEDCRKTCTK